MRNILSFILTLLLALTGCSNNAGIYANSDGVTRVDNSSFGRDIEIIKTGVRMKGDFPQGRVELINKSSSEKNIQYRFVWFDIEGFMIDNNPPWRIETLHGSQRINLQGVSLSTRAAKYEFYIRKLSKY